MAVSAYRRLEVWQQAMDLVEAIYVVSRRLPADERFGLVSQMQRAAVSIPANIAEGYGRVHRGDYVHHLSMARGSLMELETHLMIAVRLKLIPREEVLESWKLSQLVGRKLTSLIKSLRPVV